MGLINQAPTNLSIQNKSVGLLNQAATKYASGFDESNPYNIIQKIRSSFIKALDGRDDEILLA